MKAQARTDGQVFDQDTLAARDSALRHLAEADSHDASDPRSDEAQVAAREDLKAAIARGRSCGNPTVVLKALLIMVRRGWDHGMLATEIEALLGALEGEADRSAIPRLKALLQ